MLFQNAPYFFKDFLEVDGLPSSVRSLQPSRDKIQIFESFLPSCIRSELVARFWAYPKQKFHFLRACFLITIWELRGGNEIMYTYSWISSHCSVCMYVSVRHVDLKWYGNHTIYDTGTWLLILCSSESIGPSRGRMICDLAPLPPPLPLPSVRSTDSTHEG